MLNWQGNINIKSFDKNGNLVQEDKLKNLITTAGKNLLAQALRESDTDCEIKFIAIGSDNIHDVYKPYSTGDMSTELKFLLEALHMYDPETLSEIATTNGRLVIGMEEYNDGHKQSEKRRFGLL